LPVPEKGVRVTEDEIVGESRAATDGVLARGVWRRFGSVDALRGIDFSAAYGEITGMVGPNGAGKTTLLLVLATLLAHDAGQVLVGGCDPGSQSRAVRAQMGWVPDVFGVYDNLSAREYLTFAGSAYGLGRAAGARADELLGLVRLSEFSDQPVHALSRGQKQRLGFARALVHRPRILLLDEPASGLDPYSRIELRGLVRQLASDGAAVIVSSHVLADLEQMADRVVFFDHGVTVGERRIDDANRATGPRLWRLWALNAAELVVALDSHGYAHSPPSAVGVDVELDSDVAAAGLIAGLVHDGVQVVSCAPLTSTLEATYLQLTGEEA
jgi:ABC-2 type transport system ATP-binding protein